MDVHDPRCGRYRTDKLHGHRAYKRQLRTIHIESNGRVCDSEWYCHFKYGNGYVNHTEPESLTTEQRYSSDRSFGSASDNLGPDGQQACTLATEWNDGRGDAQLLRYHHVRSESDARRVSREQPAGK